MALNQKSFGKSHVGAMSPTMGVCVWKAGLTIAHSNKMPTKMATRAEGTRVESFGSHKETAKQIKVIASAK